MSQQILKVKKCRPNARLPFKATAGSAAFDLFAANDAPVCIAPGKSASIPAGVAIELPGPSAVALVFARSGLAFKHGISLVNAVGVIDSDYRGEISVGLINQSEQPFTVNTGDRIAQLMIVNTLPVNLLEVTALSDTERGTGGFGSTGRN